MATNSSVSALSGARSSFVSTTSTSSTSQSSGSKISTNNPNSILEAARTALEYNLPLASSDPRESKSNVGNYEYTREEYIDSRDMIKRMDPSPLLATARGADLLNLVKANNGNLDAIAGKVSEDTAQGLRKAFQEESSALQLKGEIVDCYTEFETLLYSRNTISEEAIKGLSTKIQKLIDVGNVDFAIQNLNEMLLELPSLLSDRSSIAINKDGTYQFAKDRSIQDRCDRYHHYYAKILTAWSHRVAESFTESQLLQIKHLRKALDIVLEKELLVLPPGFHDLHHDVENLEMEINEAIGKGSHNFVCKVIVNGGSKRAVKRMLSNQTFADFFRGLKHEFGEGNLICSNRDLLRDNPCLSDESLRDAYLALFVTLRLDKTPVYFNLKEANVNRTPGLSGPSSHRLPSHHSRAPTSVATTVSPGPSSHRPALYHTGVPSAVNTSAGSRLAATAPYAQTLMGDHLSTTVARVATATLPAASTTMLNPGFGVNDTSHRPVFTTSTTSVPLYAQTMVGPAALIANGSALPTPSMTRTTVWPSVSSSSSAVSSRTKVRLSSSEINNKFQKCHANFLNIFVWSGTSRSNSSEYESTMRQLLDDIQELMNAENVENYRLQNLNEMLLELPLLKERRHLLFNKGKDYTLANVRNAQDRVAAYISQYTRILNDWRSWNKGAFTPALQIKYLRRALSLMEREFKAGTVAIPSRFRDLQKNVRKLSNAIGSLDENKMNTLVFKVWVNVNGKDVIEHMLSNHTFKDFYLKLKTKYGVGDLVFGPDHLKLLEGYAFVIDEGHKSARLPLATYFNREKWQIRFVPKEVAPGTAAVGSSSFNTSDLYDNDEDDSKTPSSFPTTEMGVASLSSLATSTTVLSPAVPTALMSEMTMLGSNLSISSGRSAR